MDGSRTAVCQHVCRSAPGRPRQGRSALLIDPGWLHEHLADGGVRIVHVDVAAAGYDGAHLPGAVLWNIYTDLRRPDFQLVDPAAVERLVRDSGSMPTPSWCSPATPRPWGCGSSRPTDTGGSGCSTAPSTRGRRRAAR